MEASRPLLFVALGLSVISAATSAYVALGRGASQAPTPLAASACACDDASLRREIAALRRDLDARGPAPKGAPAGRLEARVAALEARSGIASPPDEDGGDATSTDTSTTSTRRLLRDGTPAMKSIDSPSPAVKVLQTPEGSLSVTNTDPTLTGKLFVVKGHAEDGSEYPLTIIVPAPSN